MKFYSSYQFVIASASPRRRELFQMLQLPFEVVTSDVEETSVKAHSAEQFVREVALLKTRDVAAKCAGRVVIGADTIVSLNNELLHKPVTEQEAYAHLNALSGQMHTVMTAVAIILPNGEEHTFVEKTNVYFKPLRKEMIAAYIASKDPFDKAGGYGIQTAGALFVDKIDGDYYNVVGLPIASLVDQLLTLQCISL